MGLYFEDKCVAALMYPTGLDLLLFTLIVYCGYGRYVVPIFMNKHQSTSVFHSFSTSYLLSIDVVPAVVFTASEEQPPASRTIHCGDFYLRHL